MGKITKIPKPLSPLVESLLWQIKAARLPTPELEIRFHGTRRWRLDIGWSDILIAVEVDGATWTGGRHTTGKGYENDCEKLNEAACLGWTVIRVTSGQVKNGMALDWILRIVLPLLESEKLAS